METSLTSSASDLSKEIKRLLHSQDGEKGQTDAASLDELRRIFAKLIASSEFHIPRPKSIAVGSGSSNLSVAQQKWNQWLRKQHDAFLHQLISAVRHGRRSSLRTFLGVIASSPDDSSMGNKGQERVSSRLFMTSQRLVILLVQALIAPYSHEEEQEDTTPLQGEREAKRRKKKTMEAQSHGSARSRLPSHDDTMESWGVEEELTSYPTLPIGPIDEGMVQLLEQEFLQPYWDARYFTLTAIRHVAHVLYRQQQEGRMKKTTTVEEASTMQQWIGSKVDNLVQILLKIHIPSSQSVLDPKMNKQGLCSNYLFSPPILLEKEQDLPWKDENDEEEDDDDDDDDSPSASDAEDHPVQDGTNPSPPTAHNNKAKETPTQKISKPSWQTLAQHRLALQQAYLAVLKIPNIRPRTMQQILTHLPTHVLPNISSPLRFADFCTRAYQIGGMTSILALQSLFFLMMEHGLEYTNFYTSLYRLIEPNIFYAKFRSRFFQLLTKCLYSNPILPAYVVAAFMKRLCQCALSAPPSGSLYVLALVSNLLRKHPECACLIHRGGVDGRSEKLQDPFDSKADDPIATRAIESSLWELLVLEKHYYHAVATMAKSCGTEGHNVLMYNMDEFVQHGYKSLFEQEKIRVGKRSGAPLTFTEPQGLFEQGDIFDGIFNVPIG